MGPLAVITGGTSGIGLATAMRFARGGFEIAILGRKETRLQAAVNQIREVAPVACQSIPVDFNFPGSVKMAAQKLLALTGRVNVLIHAAAVAPLAPFESTSSEAFDEVVNVNIRSTYFLTQALWPGLKGQGGSVIVNVSSLASVSPYTGFSAYGASKAWLDTFTKALADEGRPHDIRAYSVRPGAVSTPMLFGLFPNFPLNQTVSPEQVAEVIWQLTLPPWKFTSGEAIPISNQHDD